MRPADYSEEQIIAAGKALQAADKRVTPFGIREHMGGGQPQRIRTVWESYIAGESAQEARQEEAVELPAEFAEQVQGMNAALIGDLTAFAKRVYKRADEIAESRTREAMLSAKKAKESAETDVADAERMIGDQDAKVEALEQQLGALQEQLAGAQRDLRELEQEKAKEITGLTVENTRLGEQVNTAQSKAQAAEKALDTAATERERERLSQEQEREQWTERLAQEKSRGEGLQKELKAAHGQIEKFESRSVRLEADLEHARQGLADAQEKLRQETETGAATANALAELRIEAAALKERVAHTEELRAMLKEIQTKAPPKTASPGKRTRA